MNDILIYSYIHIYAYVESEKTIQFILSSLYHFNTLFSHLYIIIIYGERLSLSPHTHLPLVLFSQMGLEFSPLNIFSLYNLFHRSLIYSSQTSRNSTMTSVENKLKSIVKGVCTTLSPTKDFRHPFGISTGLC